MKPVIFHLRVSLVVSLILSIGLAAMFGLSLSMQEITVPQYAVGFLLAVFLVYLIWRLLFQKARSSALPSAPANGQKPKPPFAPVFHPSGSRPPSLSAAAARKLETEFPFRDEYE
jgi:threonine/homoserine/homoserine lactone efflux protein